MSVFGVVKGVRLRATVVNSCGRPIPGPANYLVTDGFVSVELTPVMRDRQDLEQANAEGRICVEDSTPPERKWYTAAIQLCRVNTSLISMANRFPQVLDWEDKPVGFRDRQRVEDEFGLAIEVWTGGKSDDDCPIPTTDAILSSPASGKQYGYLLFFAKEFTLGNIRVAAEVSNFDLSGITFPGSQWGRGPWNVDAIDALGTPGRLLEPMDNDSHYDLHRTIVPPPDKTLGSEACALAIDTLFTPPNYYYGDPSGDAALAADVAPDQAICTDDMTVWTVTLTGPPTAGDFTLSYAGQTTDPIVFNATGAAVQTALEALSNIDSDDVSVVGVAGGPYQVTLSGDGLFTGDGSGLTDGDVEIT